MNDGLANYSWLASPHGWAGFTNWYPPGATSFAWNLHQVQNFGTSVFGNIPIDTDETSGLPFGAWNTASLAPPTITTQPSGQSVTMGQAATFSVVANGTTPLSYQWQKMPSGGSSFTNISGATGASYTTPTTTTGETFAVSA